MGLTLEKFREKIGSRKGSMHDVSKTEFLEFLVEKGVIDDTDFSEHRLYRSGVKKIAEFFDDVDRLRN